MVQQFTQGGSERQCAQAAIALRKTGHEVHAAAMRAGGMRAADLEAADIPLTIFPVRSFASSDPWRTGLEFRRFLKQRGIDIVHTFDVPSNAFAIPWARAAGVRKVFASQRAHRQLTPTALRPLQALSDRLAHGIVVNCQSVREELVRDYAIPPSKIHVVYNGIDTEVFSRSGPIAALPFPPGAIVIGTLCALRPEKDLDALQKAFALLASEFPEAHLLFVGDGPERAALEANAIPGRTHFAGAQSHTPPWYRAIDIFVLPSRSEALSNSLLEAQACGCHVIASDAGGNPEAAPALFPVGDSQALAAYLRTMMTAKLPAARPLDERFTIERMRRRLEELYG